MEKNKQWLYFLIPALVAFALYIPTLKAPFMYDDEFFIVKNPLVQDTRAPMRVWTSGFIPDKPLGLYRPFTALTFLANYAAGGLNPAYYHLVNIVLHAIAALLFALILRGFGLSALASCAGALLFAVHPVRTEAVSWVVGRAEVLCCAFALLSLLLFMQLRKTGRFVFAILSALSYFLAVASKEIAAPLPAVIFIGDAAGFFAGGANREISNPAKKSGKKGATRENTAALASWRDLATTRMIVPNALFLIMFMAYMALRLNALGQMGMINDYQAFAAQESGTRFFTAFANFARYLVLVFFPADLRVDYYKSMSASVDAVTVFGFALFAGYVVIAARSFRRNAAVAFWLAFYFLFLLVVLNLVIPIGAVMAERFLYLPVTAFCALAALAIDRATLRKSRITMAAVAFTIVFLAFGARAYVRNEVWLDATRFWRTALAQAPDSEKAHVNLGDALWTRGGAEKNDSLMLESIEILRKGVALRRPDARTITSDHAMMLWTLSGHLRDMGRAREALAVYEQLTPVIVKYPPLIAHLREKAVVLHAQTLLELKNLERAREIVTLGLGLFPGSVPLRQLYDTILNKRT